MTNSERRVQRVRRAMAPPGSARDDVAILADLARRLGRDLGDVTPERLWDEMRALSPMHRGMSYAQLEARGGIQWPCPDEGHPGTEFLHARLWQEPREGPAAPFSVVEHDEPVEGVSDAYPLTLTTGRRLDSYNTGVQTAALARPCAAARPSTSPPATPRAARGARRRARAGGLAARRRRSPRARRSRACARGWCS